MFWNVSAAYILALPFLLIAVFRWWSRKKSTFQGEMVTPTRPAVLLPAEMENAYALCNSSVDAMTSANNYPTQETRNSIAQAINRDIAALERLNVEPRLIQARADLIALLEAARALWDPQSTHWMDMSYSRYYQAEETYLASIRTRSLR
jgi:hypothetical protein